MSYKSLTEHIQITVKQWFKKSNNIKHKQNTKKIKGIIKKAKKKRKTIKKDK